MERFRKLGAMVAVLSLAGLSGARPAAARIGGPGDPDLPLEVLQDAMPEYRAHTSSRARPADLPDIFGPGAVLNVGNLYMKITNNGFNGNPFPNLSSDPSGQWPGASSIEYLNFLGLGVGAVNPLATDPTAIRRVSYVLEWRPPSLDPVDHIYRAYDGIINGQRFVNDDGDHDPATGLPRIDEDFLDGHDNDGDGKIDEDYAAIGQEMFSCVMRDDTPQAINATFNEKHVPLGLEVHQVAWAYSIAGFQDFNPVEYTIINVSGHTLDSLYIGFRVDMDCGPVAKSNYFLDDFDIPTFPSGDFTVQTPSTDGRYQFPHDPSINNDVPADSALCSHFKIRVNGYTIADDDGDEGKTTGVASFLLLNNTIDPLGINGPTRVGFRAMRSFTGGTPYNQGGNPTIDQQRYEFMSSTQNIDPLTGLVNAAPGDQKGDFQAWFSVGPYLSVPNGGQVQATVAIAVETGTYRGCTGYPLDYQKYVAGILSQEALIAKYKPLDNAIAAQIAYEGSYEQRAGFPVPDFHGRETGLRAPPGEFQVAADCHDLSPRQIANNPSQPGEYTWFDFDCDYCTGAWDYTRGVGLFHHTWLAEAPPPNPALNTSVSYNFTDNPNRANAPGGDASIHLAWDNLSEVTPDPKSGWFDFRGYKIWKVANWTRPVGASGPADDDWSLLADFRWFDQADSNKYWKRNPASPTDSIAVCPKVFVPLLGDSVDICLYRGDLWDRQSGMILRPDTSVHCIKLPNGQCDANPGCINGTSPCVQTTHVKYPIGRYNFVDREVKNGFLYFYSVTAYDSANGSWPGCCSARRSGVEAEGVVPQSGTRTGKHAWVVPNPYRGFARIADRPSAWDLTPNATDPTGTHIDFMGMPPGRWTIKIFTVSGDLVADLHSTDAVNESLRPPVTVPNPSYDPTKPTGPDNQPTLTLHGYTRQQDTANDGEARWNLISRNGQDVVSGIYLFAIESSQGTQRGKFVIIR